MPEGLVPLSTLVDPESPTELAGEFPAWLDSGEAVVVTAVLERTAVYYRPHDMTDRRIARHARVQVDPAAVTIRQRSLQPRRDAAARGRAAAVAVRRDDTLSVSYGGRDMREAHRQRLEELRAEVMALRAQQEADAPFVELGRDLVELVAETKAAGHLLLSAESVRQLREKALALSGAA